MHIIGDRVWKKANAGFVGSALRCLIPDTPENREHLKDPEPCFCDIAGCTCWPTLWALDADDKPFPNPVCHVSDCQMEPLRGPDDPARP